MPKILEEGSINIENQHELLNLLAHGYGTLSRTLMEYIDNSFDSSNEFYNDNTHRYSKDIIIKILIDREQNYIQIEDNCVGMGKETLKRLGNKINDSKKKNKIGPWVNGQFGLGAHAFRLFASKLKVTTKMFQNEQYCLEINKDEPKWKLIENFDSVILDSGTIVEVSGFNKKDFSKLTLEELKKDIEAHFERLLTRNVIITISDGLNEVRCFPFNYEEIEGVTIKKNITNWTSSRSDTKIIVDDTNSIEIFIKVCKEPIGRPLYFSAKGRKISLASELDSFTRYINHNRYIRNIWTNPLVTGYIEIKNNLKPTLHRNDFDHANGERSGIYFEILSNEKEISEIIEAELRNKTNLGMKNLADRLSEILSKIAKEDNLAHTLLGGGIDNVNGKELIGVSQDIDGENEFIVPGEYSNSDNETLTQNRTQNIKGNENPLSENQGMPKTPQKRGIEISFLTTDGPNGKRSQLVDSVLYIYTSHPDFQDRIKNKDLTVARITSRLANYFAAIISSEYKEQFYQSKKIEPERNVILDEQIDFIFKFEKMMQDLVDQKLEDIGQIN